MESREFASIAQRLDQATLEKAEDAAFELLGTALRRESLESDDYEPRREVIVAALDEMRATGYAEAAPRHMADLVKLIIEDGPERNRALKFVQFLNENGLDTAGREVVSEIDRQVRAGRLSRKCIKAGLKFLASLVGTAAACGTGTLVVCAGGTVGTIELGIDAAEACGILNLDAAL